ncbi:sugar transferase [Streptomyces sp. NPDC002018]|uniref:sugar transferase n=1 Tax=Streptomyces sp. NPDC002018 TaxID=3364629 RepID=UPI0036897078
MTTESTSVPSPSGPARATGRRTGRVFVAPPRDTRDRVAPPPRQRPASRSRGVVLPLLVVDALAAVLSAVVLGDERREAVLSVQLVVGVTALNALGGLYRSGVVLSALDQLPALAARIAASWCAAAAVLAGLLPSRALDITVLLGGAAVQIVLACGGRSLVHARRRATAGDRLRSALVVGTGPAARRLTALLAQHPEYGLRPVGIVAPPRGEGAHGGRGGGGTDAPALPVLTSAEGIHRAVIQNGVQEALFVGFGSGSGPVSGSGLGPASGPGPDSGSGPGFGPRDAGSVARLDPGAGPAEPAFTGPVFTGSRETTDRSALVALFHEYGCATSFIGAGRWDTTAPAPGMARHLWGFTWHRVEPPAARRRGAVAKRLLDVVLTVPVLLAISPVLLCCALAVRCGDGPGVLFRQERVGQHGRPFTLLKFRTLRPADDHEAATRWNIANDLRMSAVGGFLRRTSLDELPQLWNVLRGDMSLVGPRPERPFFVANFSKTHPGYAARHRMPVGITGLAQVHGLRGDTSIEDRSRFDNHYIDHWSLWQDVCILLRTAASLVRPAGS